MKRKLLIAIGVIVALLVVAAVALPFLVNADSFRPRVQTELRSALGREVTIGHMELSLFAGGLKAQNIDEINGWLQH